MTNGNSEKNFYAVSNGRFVGVLKNGVQSNMRQKGLVVIGTKGIQL